jgi:hypothetical protein
MRARAPKLLLVLALLSLGAGTAAARPARAPSARAAALSAQEAALLRHDDRGIYVAFCPPEHEISATAQAAEASHVGWPPDECLKMDKGSAGASHTLIGIKDVHNWLLGGYGNDTIYGGERGDVIWGDYQPSGQSEAEIDRLHAGNGDDWIYSSHGYNEIWTGAGDDHLALVYGHGIVYCNGGGLKTFVMRYLPQNRPWRLVGCSHKAIDPYRA